MRLSPDAEIFHLKDTLMVNFDRAVAERESANGYTLSPMHILAVREFITEGRGTVDNLRIFTHALCFKALPEVPWLPLHPALFAQALAEFIPTEKAHAVSDLRASFTRRT